MKKPALAILLTIAALTAAAVIAAAVMLRAVSGDALFYMNSRLGGFYAASYRWVCLAAGILVLFWVALGVIKRKAVAAKVSRLGRRQQKAEGKVSADEKTPDEKVPDEKAPEAKAPEAKAFCTKCGKPITGVNKFCTYCGAPVSLPAREDEE